MAAGSHRSRAGCNRYQPRSRAPLRWRHVERVQAGHPAADLRAQLARVTARRPGRRRPRATTTCGATTTCTRPVATRSNRSSRAGRRWPPGPRATRRVRLGLLVGGQPVPQPGRRREDGGDGRSHQRRPPGLRTRRRQSRAGGHGATGWTRAKRRRAARLARRGADDRPSAARRRDGARTIGPIPIQRGTPRATAHRQRGSRSSSDRPARRRACGSWPATPTSGRCGSPWTTSSSSDTSAASSTSTALAIGRDPGDDRAHDRRQARHPPGRRRGAACVRRADAGPRVAGVRSARRWPGPGPRDEVARALLAYRRVGVDAFSRIGRRPARPRDHRTPGDRGPPHARGRVAGHRSSPPLAGPIRSRRRGAATGRRPPRWSCRRR